MEDYMEAIAEIFAGNMTLEEAAPDEDKQETKSSARRFSVMPKPASAAGSGAPKGDDAVSKYLDLGQFIATQLALGAVDLADDDKFYTLIENVTANAAAVVKRLTYLKRRTK